MLSHVLKSQLVITNNIEVLRDYIKETPILIDLMNFNPKKSHQYLKNYTTYSKLLTYFKPLISNKISLYYE